MGEGKALILCRSRLMSYEVVDVESIYYDRMKERGCTKIT